MGGFRRMQKRLSRDSKEKFPRAFGGRPACGSSLSGWASVCISWFGAIRQYPLFLFSLTFYRRLVYFHIYEDFSLELLHSFNISDKFSYGQGDPPDSFEEISITLTISRNNGAFGLVIKIVDCNNRGTRNG